jgi:hypothetical protein
VQQTHSAKDIILKPVSKKYADRVVKSHHYSGKVTQNSQLSFGVFLGDTCHGALQFGPSIDKHRMMPLVTGTKWHEFMELNRMAFSDELPRNSESRALSIAFRLIKRHYPQIKWIVSFADATQCGDGTIYRAAGFDLIGINKNKTLLQMPGGEVTAKKSLDNLVISDKTLNDNPVMNAAYWKKRGAKPLEGFQIKYIYFLDQSYRERLTVPILPYDEIQKQGAGMYKGNRRDKQAMTGTTGTAAVQR